MVPTKKKRKGKKKKKSQSNKLQNCTVLPHEIE